MAAGPWLFVNSTRTNLLNNTLDLDTDNFNMALLTSASTIGPTSTTLASAGGQVANGNGYTTGGVAMGPLTLAGTTVVTVDDPVDVVWTASGGSITARWACIYKLADGTILCYCVLDTTPADVTATAGNTLTVAFAASGIFQLA